jgi:hypothetical protein
VALPTPELERDLASDDVVTICRALRFLAGRHAGGIFPQGRIMALLSPRYPDRVRENAFRVVLRRGIHPLEDRRVLDLLTTATRPLLARLLPMISELAFPSAAEDTLGWCWDQRLHLEDRQAILGAVGSLGPRVAKRFVARHRVLSQPSALLVSAGLSVLATTGAPKVRGLFEDALDHANPRFRSTALEYLAPRWNAPTRLRRCRSLLQDPHHRVRSTAARLVHEESPEEAFAVLEEMVQDPEPLPRAAAAWALGELLPGVPACRPLLEILREDPDVRVAQRAQAGLQAA